MIDIPQAWEIVKATPPDQHHEKCSYRVAGMLCDCAMMRALEYVGGKYNLKAIRTVHWKSSENYIYNPTLCGQRIPLDKGVWLADTEDEVTCKKCLDAMKRGKHHESN